MAKSSFRAFSLIIVAGGLIVCHEFLILKPKKSIKTIIKFCRKFLYFSPNKKYMERTLKLIKVHLFLYIFIKLLLYLIHVLLNKHLFSFLFFLFQHFDYLLHTHVIFLLTFLHNLQHTIFNTSEHMNTDIITTTSLKNLPCELFNKIFKNSKQPNYLTSIK